MKTQEIMAKLQAKYPTEKEYLQAVTEVLECIEDVYNQHPEFEKARIIERLVEPDRMLTFRVSWVDDNGDVQTNTGYKSTVQQRYRTIQGRSPFPSFSKPFYLEVPRFRADIQERPHNIAYGWW